MLWFKIVLKSIPANHIHLRYGVCIHCWTNSTCIQYKTACLFYNDKLPIRFLTEILGRVSCYSADTSRYVLFLNMQVWMGPLPIQRGYGSPQQRSRSPSHPAVQHSVGGVPSRKWNHIVSVTSQQNCSGTQPLYHGHLANNFGTAMSCNSGVFQGELFIIISLDTRSCIVSRLWRFPCFNAVQQI